MTLPIFPKFKKLELTDKADITAYTDLYKPYSDFNFTNLWTWDTLNSRQVSLLNNNLVILFTDYRTTEPFLSFLGTNNVTDTAIQLLDYADQFGYTKSLHFIVNEIAPLIDTAKLSVTEEVENFDYIFSTQELAESSEPKLKTKRKLAKHFIKTYPDAKLIITDIEDKSVHEQVLEILYCWRSNKQRNNKECDITHEEIALKRLFETSSSHNAILSCLYLNEKMIGFSIDELLAENYAISHFIKGDISYKGVYEYINVEVAQQLLISGAKLWNWEQDLNLEGLRQLKVSYNPIDQLKKYRISKSLDIRY